MLYLVQEVVVCHNLIEISNNGINLKINIAKNIGDPLILFTT
jgi:hypothetical protein